MVSRRAKWTCWVVALCAARVVGAQPPTLIARAAPVMLVARGHARAEVSEALGALSIAPLTLQVADPSVAIDAPSSPRGGVLTEELVDRARADYVGADFPACLAKLSSDGDVYPILATHDRALAARALFWRLACLVASHDTAHAVGVARLFALLELSPPVERRSATPAADAALAHGLDELAGVARQKVLVSSPLAAQLSVDGRAPACTTPCTVEVLPGEHLLQLEGEGVAPLETTRTIRPDTNELTLDVVPAAPELAREQWRARYADGANEDTPAALALLSTALHAKTVVVVYAEHDGARLELRVTLVANGRPIVRLHRALAPSTSRGAVAELVRDALVRGRYVDPPLWKRAILWGPVAAGVVVVAGAITAGVLLSRHVPIAIGFGGHPK